MSSSILNTINSQNTSLKINDISSSDIIILSGGGRLIVDSSTESMSIVTGSVTTAGGAGIAKKLFVGGNVNIDTLTISQAVFTDASKNLVSVGTTGTGLVVLDTSPTISSPTLTTPVLGAASATSLNLTGTTASTSSITGTITNAGGIGISNTTDATSSTNGGTITTAGGVAIAKKLFVGGNVNIDTLTISQAVFTDASKNLVSVGTTGTGLVVLDTSPTLVTPVLGAASATSLNLTGTTASTSSITGTITNAGGIGISNTTDATSSTNGGTITTAGGLAVAKKAYIGTSLFVQNGSWTSSGNDVLINANTSSINLRPASGTANNSLELDSISLRYKNSAGVTIFSITPGGQTATLSASTSNLLTVDSSTRTGITTLVRFLSATLAVNNNTNILLGTAQNANNSFELRYYNIGTGSTSNRFSIGAFGGADSFSITADGNVSVNILTASQAVFTDASKNLVSVGTTGTGLVVLQTSPTLVTPVLGAASATSLNLTGTTASTSSITGTITNAGGIGISNTTDATSSTNGGTITTAGGVAIAKKLFVGGNVNIDTLTISQAVFTDASKNLVSVGTTGTGLVVLDTSPTLVTPVLGAASATSLNLTGTTASTSSITGTITNAGGIGISNTTDATSSTNGGTFTTAGGLAVAKKAYIGTSLFVQNGSWTSSGNDVLINANTSSINLRPASGTANNSLELDSTSLRYRNSVGTAIITAVPTTNYVGIGTTNPQAALHVTGLIDSAPTANGVLVGVDSNGNSTIHINSGTDTTGSNILDFSYSGLDFAGRIVYTNATDQFQFFTNGALRMTLDNTGIISTNSTAASTSNTTGALTIAGGIGISNTTDATSSTNGGTFTTAGGAAIAKRLYVGDRIFVQNGSWTSNGDDILLNANNNTIYIRPNSGGASLNNSLELDSTSLRYRNSSGVTVFSITNTGITNITNTTSSTSNTTGALTIAGGIGISNTTDATSSTNGGTFTTAGGIAVAKRGYFGSMVFIGGPQNLGAGNTYDSMRLTPLVGQTATQIRFDRTNTTGTLHNYLYSDTTKMELGAPSFLFTGGQGDFQSTFRVTGISTPLTGTGLEMNYNGTTSNIYSYDRALGQYKDFNINDTISINPSRITSMIITTASTSTTTGSLLIAGGIGISNTTDATSSTNGGTITTAGGIAAGKRIYVGDRLYLKNGFWSSNGNDILINANTALIALRPILDSNANNFQIDTVGFRYKNNLGNDVITGLNNGNFSITGTISKGGGTFEIDHPIIENKKLIHSFVEGPRCDLIYRGTVRLQNGTAVVNIDRDCTHNPENAMTDGTFESLCANPVKYLHNNDSFYKVRGVINGNILTIICENLESEDTVDWMVIAERKDNFIKNWERTNSDGFLKTEYLK